MTDRTIPYAQLLAHAAGETPSAFGAAARERLVQLRRLLIEKLESAVDGGNIALLASVQMAIDAIDAAAEEDGGAC